MHVNAIDFEIQKNTMCAWPEQYTPPEEKEKNTAHAPSLYFFGGLFLMVIGDWNK